MRSVSRLGYVTFKTPDLERMTDYYVDVIGLRVSERSSKRIILSGLSGAEALVLEPNTLASCDEIALAVDSAETLERLVHHLRGIGCDVSSANGLTPLSGDARILTDPKGTRIVLFVDAPPQVAIGDQYLGIGVTKLGHVAYASATTKIVTQFYVDALGFRVSDWIDNVFAFLRCCPDHHTLNFVDGDDTRMHHIAYELRDWSHVLRACDELGKRKIPIIWGPGRHRVGHNLFVYHRDPDDHIVELYAELDQMKSEELGYFDPRPWHEFAPQYPKVWSRDEGAPLWGLPPTADFRRAGQAHLQSAV